MELRGTPITVLKTGSYFGEIGLLRDARRNATVRALSTTLDLFVLTKVMPCTDLAHTFLYYVSGDSTPPPPLKPLPSLPPSPQAPCGLPEF